MSKYNPTADEIKDKEFVKYLYLNLTIEELQEKMRNLSFDEFGNEKLIPFMLKYGVIQAQWIRMVKSGL